MDSTRIFVILLAMDSKASAFSRLFGDLVQGESSSRGGTDKRQTDPYGLEAEVRGIHEQHCHSLIAFAKMFAGDADTAEDALQEAYHRYLVVRTEGREIENPQAWMLRVIHNLIVDWKKAQARNSELSEELAAPKQEDSTEQQKALMQLLDRTRSQLSPREIEILHLRLQGLRYVDVAESLGIGIGSVSTHLSRALRKLRKAKKESAL